MVNVRGHVRNGTYVAPHTRRSPKTPIEYYWESPLSKNDRSVKYQKMAKQNMDNNPQIVKLLMEM